MLPKHIAVGLPALDFIQFLASMLAEKRRIGGRSSREKIGNLHGEKAVKRLLFTANIRVWGTFLPHSKVVRWLGSQKWFVCVLRGRVNFEQVCFTLMSFPDSSVGKESACNAGDPGSIPGSGRSAEDRIGYPLQYTWTSLVAQLKTWRS